MAARTAFARCARPLARRCYGTSAGGPRAVESMGAARPAAGQPRIMAPGGSVHTNTYVEEWTAHRENVYTRFTLGSHNVGQLLAAVVAFPLICWGILKNEAKETDKLHGTPERRML